MVSLGKRCAFTIIQLIISFVFLLPASRGDESIATSQEAVVALYGAVRARDGAAVVRLLNAGVSPEVRFGDSDRLLLTDVNGGYPTFYKSFTPLHALALPQQVVPNTTANGRESGRKVDVVPEVDGLFIAATLLHHGAKIETRDRGGEDALDVALAHRNDSLALFLLMASHSLSESDVAARVPAIDDCVPFMPRTLSLALHLSSTRINREETNEAMSVAIEMQDKESCWILLKHIPQGNFDVRLQKQMTEMKWLPSE